ncbi:hypothetical protein CLK_0641 [Clostridium botulinum A3 str. Loch Maree]|nr:hypothetical protein CLK_0641 [Clostridium botulinum A3 str. Loch Maree]
MKHYAQILVLKKIKYKLKIEKVLFPDIFSAILSAMIMQLMSIVQQM